MDWIHQNKLKNWLILGLLIVNLLIVSLIWMQTTKTNEPRRNESAPRPSESIDLISKTLGFSEEQTKQLIKLQVSHMEQLGKNNDQLDEQKLQLAEELFRNNPDTSLALVKVKEIGEMESQVEMQRFKYFFELLSICTLEQKEKLKPIILEVMGKKPSEDNSGANQQQYKKPAENIQPDAKISSDQKDHARTEGDARPAPPSVAEKLAKYSERLRLSDEQVQKIHAVLLNARQKGEELRTKSNPDQNEIEAAKDRIRKEEDESIMKILNGDQKAEFQKMVLNRRK